MSVRRHVAWSQPLLGLGYLVVLAALILLSIGIYAKKLPWQHTATVTLTSQMAGLELNPHSEVKYEGETVGEVSSITSTGRAARITMAIDPGQLAHIPASVSAVIAPNTLFGEKFVDLRPLAGAAGPSLQDGAQLTQSRISIEIGALYSKLVPTLRAVDPPKLFTALSNLATAVDGRGAQLASTINNLNQFLARLNPNMPLAMDDLRKFAAVANVYANSAGDLLSILDSTAAVSAETLIPRERSFAGFLTSTTRVATTLNDVLARNAGTLEALSRDQLPTLNLLDHYSPEFACLVDGIQLANRGAENAGGARGPYANLGVNDVTRRAPYTYPQDLPGGNNDSNDNQLPSWAPTWGPYCAKAPPWILAMGSPAPNSQLPQGTAIVPRNSSGNSRPGASSRCLVMRDFSWHRRSPHRWELDDD